MKRNVQLIRSRTVSDRKANETAGAEFNTRIGWLANVVAGFELAGLNCQDVG